MSTDQSRAFDLPGHMLLSEPELRFGSTDPNAVHRHPLSGLVRFGPYSQTKLTAVPNPIRLALVTPSGRRSKLQALTQELERPHKPKSRTDYLPEFPGFSKVFRTQIGEAVGPCSFDLPADLSEQIRGAEKPHLVLAQALTRAIQRLRNHMLDFEVALIMLPDEWNRAFECIEEGFDLHHYVKAIAASEGICIQIVLASGALRYFCRCSVAWRLSIAIYTKAGGVPWVLADVAEDTAYVGVGYAMRPGGAERYAICCSQVFNCEGSGLEFIAYEADEVRVFGRNPFLSRVQMHRVMSRTMEIYRRKHAGQSPRRVVVHKNTPFKREEVDGCFDAFAACPEIDLVHVQQTSGWRGVLLDQPKSPHRYPCHRGTTLQLGEFETLLWTEGNSPTLANGKDYFKGGKGIPEPLLLYRHAGHGPMDDLCRSTLALTKMDWNNDGPYDRLPVTLSFAHMLANVIQRMPRLEPKPYPFRLFM